MEKDNSKIYKWLFISLAIALVIQIFGLKMQEPIDPYDSKEFLSISGNVFHGNGYNVTMNTCAGFESFKGESPTRMRQPVYPYYLILFYWFLGEKTIIVIISQIILNLLTLYLMFLIASKTFGQKLWAGSLIALGLYFPLWFTSAVLRTETLFTFLLVLSMFFLQKAIYSEKDSGLSAYLPYALCGALFSITFLTKPIAFLVCFIGFFTIWIHLGFRKALLRWSVMLISFLIVLSPWFLRNAIVLGDYTPLSTDGGYNLWNASTPGKSLMKWFESPEFSEIVRGGEGYYIDREANEKFTKLALENIKAEPINYFGRGFLRVIQTWIYFPGSKSESVNSIMFVLFSIVQILILITAIIGFRTISKPKISYFLLPAVSISIVLVFATGMARYLVPTMPFILILSGQGFWMIIKRLFRITST